MRASNGQGEAGVWSMDATERVHETREAVTTQLYSSWAWLRGVRLDPMPIDQELLRMRGGMAYAMPGVEVQ